MHFNSFALEPKAPSVKVLNGWRYSRHFIADGYLSYVIFVQIALDQKHQSLQGLHFIVYNDKEISFKIAFLVHTDDRCSPRTLAWHLNDHAADFGKLDFYACPPNGKESVLTHRIFRMQNETAHNHQLPCKLRVLLDRAASSRKAYLKFQYSSQSRWKRLLSLWTKCEDFTMHLRLSLTFFLGG